MLLLIHEEIKSNMRKGNKTHLVINFGILNFCKRHIVNAITKRRINRIVRRKGFIFFTFLNYKIERSSRFWASVNPKDWFSSAIVSQISSTRRIRSEMLSFFACSVNSLCMAGIISKQRLTANGRSIKKSAAHWRWQAEFDCGDFCGGSGAILSITE